MAKSKQLFLEIDEESGFDLLGICCHQNIVRLVSDMNSKLDFDLSRCIRPLQIPKIKKRTAFEQGDYFLWCDEEDFQNYHLVKNKNLATFVLPEEDQIDYLLWFDSVDEKRRQQFIEKLKTLNIVMGVYDLSHKQYDLINTIEFHDKEN